MKISKDFYPIVYHMYSFFCFYSYCFNNSSYKFSPVIIQKITDQCLITQNPNIDERLNLLVKLSILYISIAGLGHLIKYLQGLLTAYIGQKNNFDLRLKVFKKSFKFASRFF